LRRTGLGRLDEPVPGRSARVRLERGRGRRHTGATAAHRARSPGAPRRFRGPRSTPRGTRSSPG